MEALQHQGVARHLLDPAYLDLEGLIEDLKHGISVHEGQLGVAEIPAAKRKLALAIGGGGAAGAYSAGVLEALLAGLEAAGIRVDLLVGTSAGALNSYGVFIEKLGQQNEQLSRDPEMKQPYTSFIAAIWSYLDRYRKTSVWIAGRRSWIIDIATRGINTRLKRWGIIALVILLAYVLNPFLFVSLFSWAGLDEALHAIPTVGEFGSNHGLHFTVLGLISLASLWFCCWLVIRAFRYSLFRDVPLLRLLANTGPDGDLSRPWFWPKEQSEDRARALSRELVESWYKSRDELPELIVTAIDLTLGRECLFTLVRPETYCGLLGRDLMAVQLDSRHPSARDYEKFPGALFTLPENLLQCILSSTAVPGAFPAQQMGLYQRTSSREVRHFFVDGGAINNSPIHIAVDAGATHVISLELEPLERIDPATVDDRSIGFNLLETGVETFSSLLKLSTEKDVRRTVAWNTFLAGHPHALRPQEGAPDEYCNTAKRIIPLYRIAPRKREIETVEFDGHYEGGKRTVSLRDWLRRGLVDMRGQRIWRATMQPIPDTPGEASQLPRSEVEQA